MRLWLIKLISLVAVAGTGFGKTSPDRFGEALPAQPKIVSLSELQSKLQGASSEPVVVQGKVVKVCEKKGCWLQLATDKTKVRVKFKDYSFFVPLKLEGQTILARGILNKKTETVAELKHYAEDAGKSKAEIAKIMEPKLSYEFVASGIEVQKAKGS